MRNLSAFFFILFTGGILLSEFGCTPPPDVILTDVKLNMRDKAQQKLHDFQDQGLSDSLYTYFSHEDPTFRYLAVSAFASIQDSMAIDKLAALLADDVGEVRVAAAYAIGQTTGGRSEDYLLRAFAGQDTTMEYRATNAAILEAIGKVGTKPYLNALATISTYRPTDTLLLEGQAYGIYRYALRDMINPKATAKMVEYASDAAYPPSVRLIAANYLARAKDIKLTEFGLTLNQAISKEKDARIRMALAIALGKTKSEEGQNALLNQFVLEKDYRVKTNILRALGNFSYASVQPTVFAALDDTNIHIANSAADFFINHGDPTEASLYRRKAKDLNLNWETKIKLYEAANKNTPKYFGKSLEAINYELRQRFLQSENTYEKADIVRAMGEFGYNYLFIKENAFSSDKPVIRTASMEALDKILTMDDFSKYFGSSYFRRMKEMTGFIIEAMQNGDAGMIAVGAGTLRTKKLDFSATVDSTAIATMETALKNLDLPKQVETYNELLRTIKFFKDEEFIPKKVDYNHPNEWVIFNNLPSEGQAIIKTSKGDITLELLKNETPGSVTNFVQLTKQGFFNNKNFHRVVPNFVIQGGCSRGDGYGGLDYTIRSELHNMHYDKEGYVGMASAGKDTEGTQFFITHSPTLHLDGRYTIFAKVIEGMDVVHQITTADVIQEVILQ
ncbi:MAG: cyclophilin family peptidyl-prolyl cis-trans isomerase/HEAT repeat protein [Saprospiraceae bacterium]|jgi:cyclophilin family peptidyl-prolyl cis-trans isomerase/HEAT repeat protein